ncbi:MAG: hypothetical protein U0800_17400 [Isosphaeraceae bacterium]
MAVGTQPEMPSQGELLDFEQFIDHQLRRTRTRIQSTDVLTAVVSLAAAFVAILLLEVMIDHRVGLPLVVRQVLFGLGAASAIGVAVRFAIWPMLQSINGFYAARTIERAEPEFQNSLMTYLDFKRRPDKIGPGALAAIEAKTVQELAKVPIEMVVDQTRLIRAWYALAGAVALFCLYWLWTPKCPGDSIRRAFLFDVARPTDTRLLNIKPGDDRELAVIAGSNSSVYRCPGPAARVGRAALLDR